MKIGVLGTGMVGIELASRLIGKGHHVMLGSRTSENVTAVNWASDMGDLALNGTFKDAALFAVDMIFNCTKGEFVFQILESIGPLPMQGKILVDVSNPLDFSNGMPATLSICNDTSQGEQIQAMYPDTSVVKSLNTMNCYLMLNPKKLQGNHSVFVSGNSEAAKEKVEALLSTFGWDKENIIDLGDITTSRGSEMLLPIWLTLYGRMGSPDFNFYIQK